MPQWVVFMRQMQYLMSLTTSAPPFPATSVPFKKFGPLPTTTLTPNTATTAAQKEDPTEHTHEDHHPKEKKKKRRSWSERLKRLGIKSKKIPKNDKKNEGGRRRASDKRKLDDESKNNDHERDVGKDRITRRDVEAAAKAHTKIRAYLEDPRNDAATLQKLVQKAEEEGKLPKDDVDVLRAHQKISKLKAAEATNVGGRGKRALGVVADTAREKLLGYIKEADASTNVAVLEMKVNSAQDVGKLPNNDPVVVQAREMIAKLKAKEAGAAGSLLQGRHALWRPLSLLYRSMSRGVHRLRRGARRQPPRCQCPCSDPSSAQRVDQSFEAILHANIGTPMIML